MNCKHCVRPMTPGVDWGTWRCTNRRCHHYGRDVVLKPLSTPFNRKRWKFFKKAKAS